MKKAIRTKEHGLYKYVYYGEIIYIGKSNNSILSRIKGHAKEKKFKPYLEKAKIYYCMLPNSSETDIMEKALINQYKPILNIDLNRPGFSNMIHVEEPTWKVFEEYVPPKPIKATKEEKIKKITDTVIEYRKKLAEEEAVKAKIIMQQNINKAKKELEFVSAYEAIMEKVRNKDYSFVYADVFRKGIFEPLYRFNVTDMVKKGIYVRLFDFGDFPHITKQTKITGRIYTYVKDLESILNLMTIHRLNQIKREAELTLNVI